MAHAELSPSGAEIWFNCPGSRLAQQGIPDQSNPIAREGTVTHMLAERLLQDGELTPDGTVFEVDGHQVVVEEFMQHMAQDYVRYAREVMDDPARQLAYSGVEVRVNYKRWVQGGYGTSDLALVYTEDGRKVLHVIDLKTGYVPVAAKDNKQLMLYGLGAIDTLAWEHPEDEWDVIRLSIYATRNGGEDTWETTTAHLMDNAERFKAAAVEAYSDDPRRAAGSHCRYCKALPECRAARDHALDVAGFTYLADDDTWVIGDPTMPDPKTMNAEEVAQVLPHLGTLEKWAEAVREKAVADAVKGQVFSGQKLIQGRAQRRQWADEMKAEKMLLEMGFTVDDINEINLLSPTKALKLLTKEQAEEIQSLIKRPDSKPVLVGENIKGKPYKPDPFADD